MTSNEQHVSNQDTYRLKGISERPIQSAWIRCLPTRSDLKSFKICGGCMGE